MNFKARARYNDEEERERERRFERTSLLQKREVFFYPRLKPPSKQDQKAKKKETYRCEQRGGGGRSDGRLGELFRQVGRLDDRLVDRTVVLMIREVSISIYTSSRGGEKEEEAIIDFPSISPKERTIKQKKRTIVIQRVTPSREDQIHVPFGGNLVYGNLLAS